jgi:hypothetical protein
MSKSQETNIMNSLQVKVTIGELQSLIDDPDLKLVTKRFEGKGIPEVVVIQLLPNTPMDKFKHRIEHGEKQPV